MRNWRASACALRMFAISDDDFEFATAVREYGTFREYLISAVNGGQYGTY
jgi:hypothetical protein